MATLGDEELKQRFLELLKRDEEFRLAVAGLIGLREILEELRRLREDSNKRFEALERKLLEHDKRFEEASKRFEAIERKLLEHDEKFRAVIEEIKKIWEEIEKIWRELREMNRRVSRVEDLLGALSESVYAKFFMDTVLYELAGRGERLEHWERNARVDGEDIDLLLVAERTVYVVEVKVQPRHSDVAALLAKAELVARRYPGKRVVPVLTGTRVGREVAEYAQSKGVVVAAW
ncbi:hypothetical protein [Pyrodictium abyssi]|uniref:DUF3782 domain-containing protein n=1 Tax=Pyrodictium abyssi TaxID=54256 RepID=A0ABN6ZSV6_9CREN|nr:hypothetical protein PABY_12620 [Pyrodictium abyssi]